jgi:alpha/beta superfamily hydrolase
MQPSCADESVVVEGVRFRSDDWLLSGELAYPVGAPPVAAALVAGPHPLLGGTMTNNVVRRLGDGLARSGVVTLRFDYRGVGSSEGPAANVTDRLSEFWQSSRVDDEADYRRDAAAAAAFLRGLAGAGLPLARVGYSFGCSLLDMPGPGADSPLVLVAPTVGTHSYESFAAVTAPKLVIAPEGDFAADAGRMRAWFSRLGPPKELLAPRMDGHFFRGHEEWLAETVARFLAANVGEKT